MTRIFLVATIFALLCASVEAQQPDFQTVKTEKGMMVLNNSKVQPFSFLVAGANPRGEQDVDGSLLIQTDSNGVLVYFRKTDLFLAKSKKPGEKDVLTAHRIFELEEMNKAVGSKILLDEEGVENVTVFDLRNGKSEVVTLASSFWSYPATDPSIPNRLYFQNIVIGDQVLMLGMVFNKSMAFEKIQGMVKTIFESLTLLPPPKPVKKPQDKVIKKRVAGRKQ